MQRVFVSHSHHDRRFVETQIVPALQTEGIDTWCATQNIRTATQWEREILRGLRACDWFLVLMTPESATSEWVKHEVNWAMENRVGRIVPLLLRNCDVQEFHLGLARIQHIDCRESTGRSMTKLLSMLTDGQRNAANTVVAKSITSAIGLSPPQVPFHCGPWVPPNFFIGRDEELARAGRLIRTGHNFAIVGLRRAGKTSFCRKLMWEFATSPDGGFLLSYMNLEQGSRMSVEAFMEHTILCIVGEVARQVFNCRYSDLLRKNATEGYPGLADDLLFGRFVNIFRLTSRFTHNKRGFKGQSLAVHDFVGFTTELLEISKERGFERFVMFYDEANRLPRDISLELLNNIGESLSQTGVMGAYALSPEMVAYCDQLSGLFGKHIELGPFRCPEEMQRLLARYYFNRTDPQDGLPVSEGAMGKLWDVTFGRPYCIQLVAEAMFTLARKAGAVIVDLEHVTKAHSEVLREYQDAFAKKPR